jgi:capsular exopolysaccharide synthesis family protein
MAELPNLILNEIRQLHDDKRSGALLLTNNGERVELFFREGLVEAASSNQPGQRLGDYILKDGFLPAGDLDAVQTEARRKKILFGEAAVRRRILTQGDVGTAVRSQAVNLIAHVFRNPFVVDSFKASLRSYFSPARITFPHILLELCRSCSTPFESQSGVRLVVSNSLDLSVFPWYPQELCVLSALVYPSTFEELVNATGIASQNLEKILGVFQQLGAVEVITDGRTSNPDELLETSLVPTSNGGIAGISRFAFEHLIPVVTNAVLDEKLEVAKNASSFTSEQFKNLKVQLAVAESSAPLKVFTISSPDPQDGKSLISANLAFSFAMDPGRRVIIVDCDLRSPSLENYLGVSSKPGLLQYIEDGRLSPYCYVRRLENLYFMTAGGTTPNPIEILSMQKMKELIEHLKRDFDTIILDAPPYSPIADARIVTALSDGLIMVLRRGKTTYSSTDHAFKVIDRNKLLGIVFNDVQPMLFHTYHNFGYYGYGRKQVYSTVEKPRNSPKNYLES